MMVVATVLIGTVVVAMVVIMTVVVAKGWYNVEGGSSVFDVMEWGVKGIFGGGTFFFPPVEIFLGGPSTPILSERMNMRRWRMNTRRRRMNTRRWRMKMRRA